MDIGPGDYVECDLTGVRRAPSGEVAGGWPVHGGVYVVRAVGRYNSPVWGDTPGIKLVGIYGRISGKRDAWFPAKCFRPIYRPKADLIESLLTPIEEGVEA